MNIKTKGIVRYPHLITPSSAKGSDVLNYAVQILIHKTDPQCVTITKVVNEMIANSYPNGVPKSFLSFWKDLAIEEPNNEPLKDYMSLKASTKVGQIMPTITDENMQPLLDASVDSTATGYIAYVVGTIATYNKGSVGIKMYLNLVVLTSKFGNIPLELISSKPSIEEMYNNSIDMSMSASPAVPKLTPQSQYQMTVKATGMPREDFIANGWNDEMLIQQGYMMMLPLAPAAPAPAPVPTPPTVPTVPVQYQMTVKANGMTREDFIANGWNDEMLIQQHYMLPPNGIMPSFTSEGDIIPF